MADAVIRREDILGQEHTIKQQGEEVGGLTDAAEVGTPIANKKTRRRVRKGEAEEHPDAPAPADPPADDPRERAPDRATGRGAAGGFLRALRGPGGGVRRHHRPGAGHRGGGTGPAGRPAAAEADSLRATAVGIRRPPPLPDRRRPPVRPPASFPGPVAARPQAAATASSSLPQVESEEGAVVRVEAAGHAGRQERPAGGGPPGRPGRRCARWSAGRPPRGRRAPPAAASSCGSRGRGRAVAQAVGAAELHRGPHRAQGARAHGRHLPRVDGHAQALGLHLGEEAGEVGRRAGRLVAPQAEAHHAQGAPRPAGLLPGAQALSGPHWRTASGIQRRTTPRSSATSAAASATAACTSPAAMPRASITP